MSKKNYLILFLIIFIGIFFRVYKFNQVPASLNWDEVAIGWNAASIWEAKIDQYGTRWPISFKSYGDFKAPFLIYATAPFIGVLGMKDWVIRLPVLIFSILSIPTLYVLTYEILKKFNLKSKNIILISLLSTLLLAISPWHIRFSRGAFEATAALFFILLGLYFFFFSLKNYYFYFFSGLFFILSLYTYHSPKILIPLLLFYLFIQFHKTILSQLKKHYLVFFFYLLILLFLLIPLFKDTFLSGGGERAGTLIFFENGKLVPFNFSLILRILNNIWQHLSPRFYLYGNDSNFRNNLMNFGLMPTVQYIFFAIGLVTLIIQSLKKNYSQNSLSHFLLTWLFFALIPGILSRSESVPHCLRSLNALIPVSIISSLGFISFYNLVKTKSVTFFENNIKLLFPTITVIIFILLINLRAFYQEYFVSFPIYSAPDWQYGYRQATQIAKDYEGEVDKILVSSQYGHPYLFFAFYQERNPLNVIWGEMSQYQYVDNIDWQKDQFRKNYLLIGTEEEIPYNIPEDKGKIIDEIKFPNQEISFRIVKIN